MRSKTWTHAELGSFRLCTDYHETEWLALVRVPAFEVFRFRGARPFRGSKRVRLMFVSNQPGFIPSKRYVRLAIKVISNQKNIANKIKSAFYQDILGLGPDSGMWWHDDNDARRYCGEVLLKRLGRVEIQSPDDFEILLGEPSITIWGDEPTFFARIQFGSAFEEEHGAEAITDGTHVLGLGYDDEAEPYLNVRR